MESLLLCCFVVLGYCDQRIPEINIAVKSVLWACVMTMQKWCNWIKLFVEWKCNKLKEEAKKTIKKIRKLMNHFMIAQHIYSICMHGKWRCFWDIYEFPSSFVYLIQFALVFIFLTCMWYQHNKLLYFSVVEIHVNRNILSDVPVFGCFHLISFLE